MKNDGREEVWEERIIGLKRVKKENKKTKKVLKVYEISNEKEEILTEYYRIYTPIFLKWPWYKKILENRILIHSYLKQRWWTAVN